MTSQNCKHDLLRNIGAIMSGASIVRSNISTEDHRSAKLLEKMERECAESLKIIEGLFKQNKMEGEI